MKTGNTSGLGQNNLSSLFVGQRIEYFAGDPFHTKRYVGQQGTITGIDTTRKTFSVLWDSDDVIVNRTWKPLLKNIRPVLTDIGDLEDDF